MNKMVRSYLWVKRSPSQTQIWGLAQEDRRTPAFKAAAIWLQTIVPLSIGDIANAK